jgi:quercetin dioxygenase-like cupin family protein
MAEAGQEIGSPGGVTLLFVRTGTETEGELLEMEANYSGDGGMPPMHLHPSQAEHFEILEGSMRAIVDGEERVYVTGDSFEVPAGTPHQMAAEEPTRMRWEVRPAMRTAQFFERLYGEGPDSAREMGEGFWAEFEAEFRLA